MGDPWYFPFACYVYGVILTRSTEQPRFLARLTSELRRECVDPVEFCSARLGITPDPKQEAILRSTAKRGILLCARQYGKSTMMAVKAVLRATEHPGSLILFAAPTIRQSSELLRKAEGFLRRLGVTVRGDGTNAHSAVLPNGSRMVALPGQEGTIRGFSKVDLILIDEASRVPDELYQALRPMLLVGGGELWLMSTPLGKRGFFYESWEYGGDEWARFEAKATENPRIESAQLERERSQCGGAAVFAQDYLCEFVDTGGQLFATQMVEHAVDAEYEAMRL